MRNAWRRALVAAVVAALAAATATVASAATVGTTFPPGFPVIQDASLAVPVLGFGAAGPVRRTPVILLHGNNDTAYPGACNPYGQVHALAQYLADHGYAPSELWGLGYQGDQCDALVDPTVKSSYAHSTVANVPDLAASSAPCSPTRAQARRHRRAQPRRDARPGVDAPGPRRHLVRRLVAIDGPNHGIVDCSPSPANYFQLPAFGGFTPYERDLPGVRLARHAVPELAEPGQETPGPTRYLVIRNADTSFVYFSAQDGFFAPVPARGQRGRPHDFSHSASARGAEELDLTGQGAYDPFLGTAHLGHPRLADTWAAALAFLTADKP